MMLAQKLLDVAQVGASVVIYVLLGLSVLSIALILERWLWFRRRRVDARALGRELVARLRAGDRAAARALLSGHAAIEAQVVAEALAWYDDGPAAVAEILATSLKERRRDYDAGQVFLGTLGNNAPFIGLFGTVLGVVTAFRELGANSTGAMGSVMSGIAEALVATAIGILVALPAVVAYNVFDKKIAFLEENTAAVGGLLLAEMKRQSSAGDARAAGSDG